MDKSKQHINYKDDWATPSNVFEAIDSAFKGAFLLDVAATCKNAKCLDYITKQRDAIKQDWNAGGGLWWCNPPFSQVEAFLEKAWEEFEKGHYGIMLVPSNQETRWFRKNITECNLRRLVWPRRISFLHPDTGKSVTGNVVGSVLVAFIPDHRHLPKVLDQPWVGAVK